MAFWGKSRFLWVQIIQIFASIFRKGLYIDTISDCVTVTAIIHLIEISSCPGSEFHIGWSEVSVQGLSFFVIQLILTFRHLAFSFSFCRTSTTLHTNIDARLAHLEFLQNRKQETHWLNFYEVKIICISSGPRRNTWVYKTLTCHCEDSCQNYFCKIEQLLISISISSIMIWNKFYSSQSLTLLSSDMT